MQWLKAPRNHSGRLVSGGAGGFAVHAASFPRRRLIILDLALSRSRLELQRILIHEIFHFVWVKFGNAARWEWEDILHTESRRRARGELGWSAEARKGLLTPNDRSERTRFWREYVCESFCDTAAFAFSSRRRHPEFTLAKSFRARRLAWMSRLPQDRFRV